MRVLILCLMMTVLVAVSGCARTGEMEENAAEQIKGEKVNISSGSLSYPAYLAAPGKDGIWPGVVMIHSFNGLEPGYLSLADRLAEEGYVVVAPEWQSFNRTPPDDTVGQLIQDCSALLRGREDVQADKIGLTGFCAGGRYTMLFLPLMNRTFSAGVAWYGFPYSGGFLNESRPVQFIDQLDDPMLIIHGTYDVPSKIKDVYRYAEELNASGRYFEMKIYQGQPHGFMIEDGKLSRSFAAEDALHQMVSFFDRTLKGV